VEKALTVQEHGSSSLVQAVENGRISIQKAYQEIQRLRFLPPPLPFAVPQWHVTKLEANVCAGS